MTVFADSSALVKLYADEDGAEPVRALSLFVVSALARVEVPAALWRKNRVGELSVDDTAVLVAAFESDWYDADTAFVVVPARSSVIDRASALVAAHGLRAYDGVQLASAVAARAADAAVDTFLCFDEQLVDAAARVGFTV